MTSGILNFFRHFAGRNRPERAVALAVAAAAITLAAAAADAAGDFPGPEAIDLSGEALSAVSLPLGTANQDYLIGGTADGVLQLNRYLNPSKQFQILVRQFIGGEIVHLIRWEDRPLADQGIVAAVANPDRLVFLRVSAAAPYFIITGEIPLEEDPGTLAFLGDRVGDGMRLAVSLPGIDKVAFLDQLDGNWSLSEVVDVGDEPHSIAGADLDGDQVRELVLAQRGPLSGTLGVFRRGVDESYTFSTQAFVPGTPREIAAFDLEGDGRVELVAVVAGAPEVAVLGEVAGQIQLIDSVPLNLPADHLHLAPLFDGKPALFTGNRVRGLVEFFTHDGTTWSRRDSYYPGCNPQALVTSDLNGDSGRDLISVGGLSESVTVLFANGEPGFWGYPALALDGNPGSSATGDFDGDGATDLVVAATDRLGFSFFAGLPAGGFVTLPEEITLDFLPGMIVALDADADAAAELAVLDVFSGQVCLLDHSPAAGFVVGSRTTVGTGPFFLNTGDIDNDTRADLLVITREAQELSVVFGNGDGTFTGLTTLGFTSGADRVEPLDLNNDGWLELAVTDGLSRVWTTLNLDGRSFGGSVWLNAGAGATGMVSGDLDGDLDADLIVVNRSDESLTFFENDGSGALVRKVGALVLPALPEDIFIQDIDQNGTPELVMNLQADGKLGVSYRLSAWSYGAPFLITAGPNVVGMSVEDLNLDTVPDILTLDQSLQLGLTLLNVEQVMVAVADEPLTARCAAGLLEITVVPQGAGGWLLEAGQGDGWWPLADSGRALIGSLDYERGRWFLSLDPGKLTAISGEPTAAWSLRLTAAAGTGTVTQLLPLGDLCPKDGGVPAGVAVWTREPWPNPFNPLVHARFSLPRPAAVEVGVFDLAGRKVAVLSTGVLPAGDHQVRWDGSRQGRAAAAGVYLLRVRTPDVSLTRKIMLLK